MVARQHLMTSSERKFHLESGDVWLLGTIVQAWFYIKNLSNQWKIQKKLQKKLTRKRVKEESKQPRRRPQWAIESPGRDHPIWSCLIRDLTTFCSIAVSNYQFSGIVDVLKMLYQQDHVLSPANKIQLLWGRCINVHGRKGKNILDMEHLNLTA